MKSVTSCLLVYQCSPHHITDQVAFEAALKNHSSSLRQTVEYDFHFALNLILDFRVDLKI